MKEEAKGVPSSRKTMWHTLQASTNVQLTKFCPWWPLAARGGTVAALVGGSKPQNLSHKYGDVVSAFPN